MYLAKALLLKASGLLLGVLRIPKGPFAGLTMKVSGWLGGVLNVRKGAHPLALLESFLAGWLAALLRVIT